MKTVLLVPANSQDEAISHWKNSQFNMADICTSLADTGSIETSVCLSALFKNESFLKLMNLFVCDFEEIKNYLGIDGEYLSRTGDIYSKSFNPERHPEVLKLSPKEMKNRAESLFEQFLEDVKEISQFLEKNAKK